MYVYIYIHILYVTYTCAFHEHFFCSKHFLQEFPLTRLFYAHLKSKMYTCKICTLNSRVFPLNSLICPLNSLENPLKIIAYKPSKRESAHSAQFKKIRSISRNRWNEHLFVLTGGSKYTQMLQFFLVRPQWTGTWLRREVVGSKHIKRNTFVSEMVIPFFWKSHQTSRRKVALLGAKKGQRWGRYLGAGGKWLERKWWKEGRKPAVNWRFMWSIWRSWSMKFTFLYS